MKIYRPKKKHISMQHYTSYPQLIYFFPLKHNTPSVSNYKKSQESWRIKAISSLTKIIERNIKIYDIKLMYYKNIINKESNGT